MMKNRIQQQWEALGTDDPYWAVLSDPGKQHGGWDKKEFFQTGANEIEDILTKASSLGVDLQFGLALDYGCGVGRLSRALSTRFQRVLGIDISDAMLTEARSANAGFDNIQFLRNNGTDLPGVVDKSVDFIYSNIVLQHSPRKTQQSLIKEFCRVLRPGGILIFQTPARQNLMTIKGALHFLLGNRVLNIGRTMKYGKARVMEMHTFAKNDVLDTLRKEEMSPLKIDRYDTAGKAFISYIYFVTKH
ncbi:putative Methylase involved in ubiquinone/menaquinonebiosynthesis-like protein [Paraburkholderia ribeironis]|uniref:Putative Methylase involved in ubiquinone/menaquinonebiosynthesis-like protein n=2 Tax=Paraburkholderia ribeironis TaxID=1247936 RepID=A0A1N7S5V0_9BURK|nr:putative Methylase involved in ubiquinone/menaquinonebiosynthesis-like protein [Paraburkholderia ribeironis]